ncbi:hypothetical protein LIER_17946 [Lithospermum erythrorhizon]|uniref:Urease accessory protein D n=1 Tax=Lithospermum erythrorhizon TaxID=34254 RepID=A0AAV3QC60_LITER
METGKVVVEKVADKSTVTRCFSKYPLKFIIPRKVGSSQIDAVWIYTITYGGGIVSGDSISIDITVGEGCTTVLTTQASTKVYKSVGSKRSDQVLQASIGANSLLVVIPDPVTCFASSRYSQLQMFNIASESSLLLVDWITSGRHESGEKWDFSLYKSSNQIFMGDDNPIFLDTILLEHGSVVNIKQHMQDYQVIAMVVLLGPKLEHVSLQIQEDVKNIMSQHLHAPSIGGRCHSQMHEDTFSEKPDFIASCSVFGPKGMGVIVRIASTTTESVYNFLRHELRSMEPLLGIPPYTTK